MPVAVTDALATYRLTRLITTDSLTAELRGAIVRDAYRHRNSDRDGTATPDMPLLEWAKAPLDDDDPPKVATLATCPWCAGMWVAFGVVAARRFAPRLWDPIARALAASAVAGFLSLHDG